MKLMLSLFTLLSIHIVCSQTHYGEIEISSFKEVVIRTPHNLPVEKVVPGMDDRYILTKIIPPNLVSIKAVENMDFPPTNITIYCSGAIFQADLRLNHGTNTYFHDFKESNGILLTSAIRKDLNEEQDDSLPEQAKKEESPKGMFEYNPEYNAPELPVPLQYFDTDRHVEGADFNGLIVYVNNLISTNEYIYISFKVQNDSSIPFHTDFVKLFIKSGDKKKSVATINSGSEPLFSSQVNNGQVEVLPGETELYVYEFDKFSLGKTDLLHLSIEEGNGKRTAEVEIKSKRFDKMIEFKF